MIIRSCSSSVEAPCDIINIICSTAPPCKERAGVM